MDFEKEREEKRKKEAERKEWLSSLKSGDKVVDKVYNHGKSYYRILEIEKVTPTGKIRLKDGTLLDSNGYKYGEWGGSITIEPLTEEIKKEIILRNKYSKITRIDLSKVIGDKDEEQINKVYDAFKELGLLGDK